MVQQWSSVLRQLPFQKALPAQPASGPGDVVNTATASAPSQIYTTSIHVAVSACLKLSRQADNQKGRRAFRALQALDSMWLDAKGRVELGFLSATMDKDIAVGQIKGKPGTGVLLEFDAGEVDYGARLDSISQYPGGDFDPAPL